LAGGTGEVLLEGLCHRIAGVEDVDGFERAIREVLDDPPAARARASELREVLRARRAPAVYREAVRELLAADGIE
jgi:glycosyltransferase involved in cell wall biosynthesis